MVTNCFDCPEGQTTFDFKSNRDTNICKKIDGCPSLTEKVYKEELGKEVCAIPCPGGATRLSNGECFSQDQCVGCSKFLDSLEKKDVLKGDYYRNEYDCQGEMSKKSFESLIEDYIKESKAEAKDLLNQCQQAVGSGEAYNECVNIGFMMPHRWFRKYLNLNGCSFAP